MRGRGRPVAQVGRRQERNSREYWVSCCADRIASIGVNAWRRRRRSASAPSTAAGIASRERGEDALARALAERHRLQRRLHHVLGPAEGEAQQRVARRGAAARGGQRERQRPGRRRRERGELRDARIARRCRVGAASRPSNGPSAGSAGATRAVSRVAVIQAFSSAIARAGRRAARPRSPARRPAARCARGRGGAGRQPGARRCASSPTRPASIAASRPSE